LEYDGNVSDLEYDGEQDGPSDDDSDDDSDGPSDDDSDVEEGEKSGAPSDDEAEDGGAGNTAEVPFWTLNKRAAHAALAALPPVVLGTVNVASTTMVGGGWLAPAALRNTPEARAIAQRNLADLKSRTRASQECHLRNCTPAEIKQKVADARHDVTLIAGFAARSIRLNLHRVGWGVARASDAEDEEDYLLFKTEFLMLYEKSTRESSGWCVRLAALHPLQT
jgi:hypothetical protein